MINLINTFCEEHKSADIWSNSPFKGVKELTNDHRGKLGEIIISQVFHYLNYNIDDDISDNNIKPDGHYDLKVENQRVEVKTACAETTFQHEPLYRANVCDIVIFVDFTYDKYWISICKNNELPLGKDSEIFGGAKGKHGTLRKNKDDGWKLDFSRAVINRFIKIDYARSFDENSSIQEIANFINSWWKKNV